MGWREVVSVVVGGVIGTALRFGLDTLVPHTDTGFPVSTLIINVVGSFLLGLLVSTVWTRASTPTWVKAGVGPGILGSFTTFSAVMVSLIGEVHAGEWMLALVYLLVTLVLGFAAALLGLRIGRRTPPPDLVDE